MFFERRSFFKKVAIITKTVVLAHVLALTLNLLFIFLQKMYDDYCYLPNVCICSERTFATKVFVTATSFFEIWIYLIFLTCNTLFYLKLLQEKKRIKVAFFTLLSSVVVFFLMTSDPGASFPAQKIHMFGIAMVLIFSLYVLFLMGGDFKQWCRVFVRGNFINAFLIINYFFVWFIFPDAVLGLRNCLPTDLSQNLLSLMIMLYSILFKYGLEVFCWWYYENLISESKEAHFSDLQVIWHMRFVSCHYVALNTVVMLKLSLQNWSAWILILNYILYLIKSYSKFDIFAEILFKIREICFKGTCEKKTNPQKPEKFLKFQKIFSGCTLDLQFISFFRLLTLYFWGSWSFGTGSSIFYENCEFEVNFRNFAMNLWVIILLGGSNFLIIFVILRYIRTKRRLLLFYTIHDSLFVNALQLFSLHFQYESIIQMDSYIFWMSS